VGQYRPSPVIRWPLHLLNVLLTITILALIGVSVALVHLEEEPPWALVGVGSGICLLFFAFNLAVASLELRLDGAGVGLRAWPWRRRIPWQGAEVRKIVRPVGVIGVRIIGESGEKVWISQAWFSEFDEALAEIESMARERGVEVLEVDD
jgi:hypothetical protein